MTQKRYLKMCEQLGKEPDLDEMPPDWEDFPDIAISGNEHLFPVLWEIECYPDIGYVGKDFTNLSAYYRNFKV